MMRNTSVHIIVTSLARNTILRCKGLRTRVYLNVVPTIPSHDSLFFFLFTALWIAALHLAAPFILNVQVRWILWGRMQLVFKHPLLWFSTTWHRHSGLFPITWFIWHYSTQDTMAHLVWHKAQSFNWDLAALAAWVSGTLILMLYHKTADQSQMVSDYFQMNWTSWPSTLGCMPGPFLSKCPNCRIFRQKAMANCCLP